MRINSIGDAGPTCLIVAACLCFTLLKHSPAHSDTLSAAPPTGPAGIAIPQNFRDWRLISVAHEEGGLHSFAAVLGNDVAMDAYRNHRIPFPDGTIIASLHY